MRGRRRGGICRSLIFCIFRARIIISVFCQKMKKALFVVAKKAIDGGTVICTIFDNPLVVVM